MAVSGHTDFYLFRKIVPIVQERTVGAQFGQSLADFRSWPIA